MGEAAADAVLKKIRKLLALAKSTNPHEAAAAAGAAARLMEEHDVSEATIEAHDGEPIVDVSVFNALRPMAWRHELFFQLAKHHGCRPLMVTFGGGASREYHLVGRRADVELVRVLFAWLDVEIARLVDRSGLRGRTPRASFAFGVVRGVQAQLEATRAEVRASASPEARSAALVRVDQAAGRIDEFLRQGGRAPEKARARKTRLDGSALRDGEAEGRRLHLGKTVAEGRGRLLGEGGKG